MLVLFTFQLSQSNDLMWNIFNGKLANQIKKENSFQKAE